MNEVCLGNCGDCWVVTEEQRAIDHYSGMIDIKQAMIEEQLVEAEAAAEALIDTDRTHLEEFQDRIEYHRLRQRELVSNCAGPIVLGGDNGQVEVSVRACASPLMDMNGTSKFAQTERRTLP